MSLGATDNESLDIPNEVKEISETPGLDNAKIETIEGPEDAEKLLADETSKAEAVVDFTEEAVESATSATGDSSLVEDERRQLQFLRDELTSLTNDQENQSTKFHLESSWLERYPDGKMAEVKLSSELAFPDDNAVEEAINTSNLTTGRLEGLSESLGDGIKIHGTTINETLSEVPSVFCGKKGNNILESESFRRNYGDIYNPASEGYILLLNIPESDSGYVDNGIEVQVERDVQPNEIKGIVVGNDTMYERAVNLVQEKGLNIPILKTEKTASVINSAETI